MARLMSVAFTEEAVVERRKRVTRRAGWWRDRHGRFLIKPGDHLTLCRKVMGRKAGEPLVRLAQVEVVGVRRERLSLMWLNGDAYGAREVELEGFPGMDPREFVRRYFTEAQGLGPSTLVTRIEWRYLDEVTE